MARSISLPMRRAAMVTAIAGSLALGPVAGAMAIADAPAKPASGHSQVVQADQTCPPKKNKKKGKRVYVVRQYTTYDGLNSWKVTVWSNGKVTKQKLPYKPPYNPPRPKPTPLGPVDPDPEPEADGTVVSL